MLPGSTERSLLDHTIHNQECIRGCHNRRTVDQHTFTGKLTDSHESPFSATHCGFDSRSRFFAIPRTTYRVLCKVLDTSSPWELDLRLAEFAITATNTRPCQRDRPAFAPLSPMFNGSFR